MTEPLDEHQQTRMAVAAMFPAFARTAGQGDPTFLPRFDKNLEDFYHQIQAFKVAPQGTLDALKWASQLLR